jgi:hypothetical protein
MPQFPQNFTKIIEGSQKLESLILVSFHVKEWLLLDHSQCDAELSKDLALKMVR